MAEIRNYTVNFGCGITCYAQVSLRRNESLKRLVVGPDYDLLRPEVHG
jgi:hypothetical protein